MSIPHAYHQTPAQKELTDAIAAFFQSRQIPVCTKTPAAFGAFCPERKKKRKEELMHTLVQRFPELEPYYRKELRNKKRYYFKLFEAVAVALLAQPSVL